MRAVIFGITGQDGSYLSELLLAKGYDVFGVNRRVSVSTDERIKHLFGNPLFHLTQGDITDMSSVISIIRHVQPDEVYNLAAQSHVGTSFKEPLHSFDVTAKGAFNVLEAIRQIDCGIKFYQASSSEMFGSSLGTLYGSPLNGDLSHGNSHYRQDESTPMLPCSPYAIAKLAAHHATRLYREAYGLHASAGILFNHESERRGASFVTRKITKYVGDVYHTQRASFILPRLKLGNIHARRDWGHAEDYVRAMWLMLQQDTPDDYVIATGETHTVEEFLEIAFGYTDKDWHEYVEIDETLKRPKDVGYLCGNSTKAHARLGWWPKVTFSELVRRMLVYDMGGAAPVELKEMTV